MKTHIRASSGQSIVEFAILLPLVLVVALGVIETSYALLNQHVVTKLTREGSNLISRDSTIQDASNVLRNMSTAPVDFNNGTSTVIFSVLKRGGTSGTANYDRIYLYQRAKFGSLAASSKIVTQGGGSFGGPPNYEAANADNNSGLRVVNPPAINVRNGYLYITEVYTTHNLITPLNRFGVTLPNRLYSIAYF
jgi:hypothetical protein